jgi:ArsR family transcriptional regulator
MDLYEATTVFDALSQETRLRIFRMLIEAGADGLPAGTLSKELGTPHNTLSFHLSHLWNAGVVKSRREGRSIIYRADFEIIGSLIGFMIKDCCSAKVAHIRKDRKKGCSVIELADFCISPKNAPRARR